jgi:prepilin-type N-terminal cleavage/methylation domain-containing protein
MRRGPKSGYTLPEILAAMAMMSVVTAVIGTAMVTIRKSAQATSHYILETNNAARLVDYVSRDLSRALRVGQIVNGTYTTMKNVSGFNITETSILAINIPDYYAGNTPDNRPESPFKTSRYARATPRPDGTWQPTPGANGATPWADAVMVVNGKQVARYAPKTAASDEIQVRYSRGPRSAQDPTVCYFRREYTSAGAPLAPAVEIAEQVVFNGSTTSLTVDGLNNGTLYRLQSAFAARFSSSNTSTTATNQMLEVALLNERRD